MSEEQRIWDAWLTAFSRVNAAAPHPVQVTCPSCGRGRIRVAYTGDPEIRIGYAIAWCDNCSKGIHLCRVGIPKGVENFTSEPSDDEVEAVVPNNVELIPPSLWIPGEEDERDE